MKRSLLALVALLGFCSTAVAQTKPLPLPELRGNDIMFGNALKLGRLEGGKTTLTPNAMQILGAGPTGSIDTTFAGVTNPNVIMAATRNRIAFCPALSCIMGPPNGSIDPNFFGRQRASFFVSSETDVDMEAEEQTVGITTTVNKGYLKKYAASTAYALGDNVLVGPAFGGAIYRVTQAGTTSASAPPPPGRPTSAPFTFADGTARLLWINDSAIAAKVGLYNEIKVMPGGGNSWGQANNIELAKGMTPGFHNALELDFSNHSGTDCVAGIANCLGLYIRMAGTSRNTSAISVEGVESTARGLFGARFVGPLADTTIDIGTDGVTGIGLGTFTPAKFSSAAISDRSTAPVGLNMDGIKSVADVRLASAAPVGLLFEGNKTIATINDTSVSPVGLNVTGTKSLADIRLAASAPSAVLIEGARTSSSIADSATSPIGLNVTGTKSLTAIRLAATAQTAIDLSAGTYSAWQIFGKGFNIDTVGNLSVASAREMISAAPGSSSSPCSTGQRQWDQTYEYRCVATNTWKRLPYASGTW